VTFSAGTAALDEAVVAKIIEIQSLRDRPLAGHARRTAEVAVAIGGALRCDIEMLDMLYLAGQLHDIGKLGVTESTLWKPAGLSHAEWREIRTHPEEGHRLVADVVHRDVASAVLYHHERLDRGGYPFGIDARSLPLVARVVTVADAFDAMTAGRPYQAAVTVRAAIDEIERCAGTQFDGDVAAALRRVYLNRGDPRITPGNLIEEPESPPVVPEIVDLTDAPSYGPADPSPADPFEQSPSMVRLRRSS
jgi:HD-GYP domain-containing protein (c-di-GMP phosphodiesterase class II)